MLRICIFFISLLTLGACSTIGVGIAPPEEIKSPEMGMIFGNIQASERVIEVSLREYGKVYIRPFNRPPRVLIYKNGDFMAENLKPGKYIFSSMVTLNKRFNLVQKKIDAYQHIVTVHPGELVYIGSFKLFELHPEDRHRENFKVLRMRKPDERTLIKRLYEKSIGTGWQDLFARKLMALR
ncbi:hypothetical protein MNBD_GAMMA24-2122 [hydrothermal vent metagenome]|uniref:DUF2846 domain-containing protein n=1 Tax=hydrothermal vent metagenome TaxID=652676 RepID=A0A3B1C3X5_9ZZZZ